MFTLDLLCVVNFTRSKVHAIIAQMRNITHNYDEYLLPTPAYQLRHTNSNIPTLAYQLPLIKFSFSEFRQPIPPTESAYQLLLAYFGQPTLAYLPTSGYQL